MGKTTELSNEDRDKTCTRHKTISKKPGEEVTTAGAIIWKLKKYQMIFSHPWSPHGVRMIMIMMRIKPTQEELVNDLKAVGTTATKNTITLRCNGVKSCSKALLLKKAHG